MKRLTAPTLVLIGLCALVYFLDGLIHSILGPVAPGIARTLALGNDELGPIFSANLIGQCIGLVAFPPVAARFGDRWTVGLTLAGFGLAQAASGLAGNGADLFWMRLVTGIFLGGCLPSCLAMVTAAAPPQRRGLAITALFTGYGLGAAMAGLVAVAFLGLGGWRIAMAAIGLLCLGSSAIALIPARYCRSQCKRRRRATEGKSVQPVIAGLPVRHGNAVAGVHIDVDHQLLFELVVARSAGPARL